MAIIYYPKLDVSKSINKFLGYAEIYNADKPNAQQLKPIHKDVFARIASLASNKIYSNNKEHRNGPRPCAVDTSIDYTIGANNKLISQLNKKLQISTRSVGRHIDRLMEAKVVKKIWHGPKKNYELLIDPTFLSYVDLTRNGPGQIGPRMIKNFSDKTTNCRLSNTIPHTTIKNIIIPVSNTNRPVGEKNFSFENKTENIPDGEKLLDSKGFIIVPAWIKRKLENEKKNLRGAAAHDALHVNKSGAAKEFFFYAVNNLFQGRDNIRLTEMENAFQYVVKNYFATCHDYKSIDQVLKNYKWRVDVAKRYILSHDVNMEFIFPSRYFDLSRKGIRNNKGNTKFLSFANTAGWPKYFEKFKKKNKDKTRKYTDEQVLNHYLRKYFASPKVNTYVATERLFKEKYPHLLDKFLGHVTNPFPERPIMVSMVARLKNGGLHAGAPGHI